MSLQDINKTIEQSVVTTASETQTISMTDVISEGPIHGLVDGVASVHLNDNTLTERTVCPKFLSKGPSYYVARNNSTTADLRIYGATFEMASEVEDSKRILVIRDLVGKKATLVYKEWGGSKNRASGIVLSGAGLRTYAQSIGYTSTSLTALFNTILGSSDSRKTVRLKDNSSLDEVGGYVKRSTTRGLNENNDLVFQIRSFDSSSGDSIRSKRFDLNDGDQALSCTVFFDEIIEISSLNSTTVNSDGSTTFNVTLAEAWTHNEEEAMTTFGGGSSNTEIVLGSNTLKTGDRVLYRNDGSGSNITALTPNTVEYFVSTVDANTIELATTRANAFAGVVLNTSGGSGGGSNHILEKVGQKFDDMGYQLDATDLHKDLSEASVLSSVAHTQVQFRSGTLMQPPMSGSGGVGSSAITNAIALGISQTNESNFGGDQAPIILNGISSTGFALSSSTAPEVDQIRIRWSYNSGFKGVNTAGNDFTTLIRYKVSIFVKEVGNADFSTTPALVRNVGHNGRHSNAVSFEETFNVAQLAPFKDFQVKIERQDADTGDAYKDNSERHGGATNVTKGIISSVTSILNEKLSHPLTAMAKVSYSSKKFKQTPTRSYHCRGMLIKVPSNYLTREETGGAAKYTGKTTSPASTTQSEVSEIFDSEIYQDWDGTFRAQKVYTNNPAWIFYDIITNNRYGLGDFVNESDIDKYALYRIARYCDEEIDDGNGTGTTEPRYTMNTYLIKSTDAQKVLKDMLTNFVSILYYLDGQIHPVQDAPSGPIYNFTKANVINGEFTYEHAGNKTRTNQVIVAWNNPENNFKPEPLIVEDRKDIVKTGKTISKKVVAYGCTSRGQALRYGKWKLFTSINQQELVSFTTGINGSFITPGDVINVQNADRDAVRLGGRIKANLLSGLTETATYSGAIGGSVSGFTSTQRGQPAVFSGIAVLPSSFSNSAEVLFEHGGTGSGTHVGMVDVSGTKKLIVRSGHGTAGSTASDANQVVKLINISDIAEFDDQSHRVTLEVHPTATGGGSVRFWIDNRLVVDETTTGSNFNSSLWSGGDAGGWGQRGDSLAGYDSTTTPAHTDFQNWSGTLVTNLSVYSNQTVSVFPTRNQIPIDSAVTIDTNNTYDLSVILQKDAAFLTQDSASIAFTMSCTTVNGDKTVTHSADSNIRPGLKVTGDHIPADTVIASINSTTSFELSNAATDGSTASRTFTADYVQGDSVTHAYIDSNSDGTYTLQAIDSSTDAVNAKASATGTEGLLLAYKDAFVVETQAVDKTATGTGSQSSIVVSTGFTSTPTAEDMWVLQEKASTGLNIAGSAKEYKVLAITEDDNHKYSITAVEHFDSKYDAIEQDFTLYVPDELNRPIKSTDVIPKPTDVFIQVIQTPAGEHETVRVFFTPAKASTLTLTGSDGADTTADRELNYEFAGGIEITHNIPGQPSPLIIPYEASVGFFDFLEVPVGNYEVQVRTIAVNNNTSLPVRRPFEVTAILRNRLAGYFPEAAHSGGSSTKGVEII